MKKQARIHASDRGAARGCRPAPAVLGAGRRRQVRKLPRHVVRASGDLAEGRGLDHLFHLRFGRFHGLRIKLAEQVRRFDSRDLGTRDSGAAMNGFGLCDVVRVVQVLHRYPKKRVDELRGSLIGSPSTSTGAMSRYSIGLPLIWPILQNASI